MALMRTIQDQHGSLFGALRHLEALVEAAAPDDELLSALGAVQRALMAHEMTAERFVVGPLRRLSLLDAQQLSALREEFDHLTDESARLATGAPDPGAVAHFVRAASDHVERKARVVVPAARAALRDGRLPAPPAWFVDEVYARRGGPVAAWPEQWLG